MTGSSETPKGWESCPHGASRIQRVPIVYGLPGWDLAEAEKNGEVVLGGCVVSGNDPEWACPNCHEPLQARVQ